MCLTTARCFRLGRVADPLGWGRGTGSRGILDTAQRSRSLHSRTAWTRRSATRSMTRALWSSRLEWLRRCGSCRIRSSALPAARSASRSSACPPPICLWPFCVRPMPPASTFAAWSPPLPSILRLSSRKQWQLMGKTALATRPLTTRAAYRTTTSWTQRCSRRSAPCTRVRALCLQVHTPTLSVNWLTALNTEWTTLNQSWLKVRFKSAVVSFMFYSTLKANSKILRSRILLWYLILLLFGYGVQHLQKYIL